MSDKQCTCGAAILAGGKAKYCAACAQQRVLEQHRERGRLALARKRMDNGSHRKDLRGFVREIVAYNEAREAAGLPIVSYGQYVATCDRQGESGEKRQK